MNYMTTNITKLTEQCSPVQCVEDMAVLQSANDQAAMDRYIACDCFDVQATTLAKGLLLFPIAGLLSADVKGMKLGLLRREAGATEKQGDDLMRMAPERKAEADALYDKALGAYYKLLKHFEAEGDIVQIAGLQMAMGGVWEKKGKNSEALHAYRTATSWYQEAITAGMSKAVFNAGIEGNARLYTEAVEAYGRLFSSTGVINEIIDRVKPVREFLDSLGATGISMGQNVIQVALTDGAVKFMDSAAAQLEVWGMHELSTNLKVKAILLDMENTIANNEWRFDVPVRPDVMLNAILSAMENGDAAFFDPAKGYKLSASDLVYIREKYPNIVSEGPMPTKPAEQVILERLDYGLLAKALEFERKGQFSNAARVYSRMEETHQNAGLEADMVSAMVRRGNAYFRAGMYASAEKAYMAVVSDLRYIDPKQRGYAPLTYQNMLKDHEALVQRAAENVRALADIFKKIINQVINAEYALSLFENEQCLRIENGKVPYVGPGGEISAAVVLKGDHTTTKFIAEVAGLLEGNGQYVDALEAYQMATNKAIREKNDKVAMELLERQQRLLKKSDIEWTDKQRRVNSFQLARLAEGPAANDGAPLRAIGAGGEGQLGAIGTKEKGEEGGGRGKKERKGRERPGK